MSTPIEPPRRSALEFFDRQFERQVQASDYTLNPFERSVLPHLSGDVLDLGCGLGNLALAAAERGCRVTALDASATAIADLSRRAGERGIELEAHSADLRHYVPAREYDSVVSIGLLMFLACADARGLLARLREAVRPGGLAAVNVLIEGTTFMDMFDPDAYCLFRRDELSETFAGWNIQLSSHEDFPAPRETVKRFHTVLARRGLRGAAATR
jgi:tellurite methyltransferase